jgi:hypothetical protein
VGERHNVINARASDMRCPSIERCGALAGEIVTLVDGSDTAQLRRLVSEQLIYHDAVEAEFGELGHPGAAQVVQAPWGNRRADLSITPIVGLRVRRLS